MQEGTWRARQPSGAVTEYNFDQLMAAMDDGEVTADTLLSVPVRPDDFKPAGEIGTFWIKFGTRPWRIKVDKREYTAQGDAELQQWTSAGRVIPSTQVYDPVEEEWTKASEVSILKGAFKTGCLGLFALVR